MNRTGVIALTLVAFGIRWFLLSGPHPPGTDGYAYLVQAQSWASTGELHMPDRSWVLRLLGMLAWGMDPLLAHRTLVCTLAAAVVPAAAWLGERTGGNRTMIWLAVWAAASPTLTHLAVDFGKNLGVAAPWLCVLAAAVRPIRPIPLVLATLLTVTAHRTGAVMVVAALIGWVLTHLDRRQLGWGAVGVLTTAALGFAGGLYPAHLMERAGGQLAFTGVPPPFAWFAVRAPPWPEMLELSGCWVALVVGGLGGNRRVRILTLPFLALALVPVWQPGVLDLGYRLMLLGPLCAAPLLLVPRLRPSSVGPGSWMPWLGALALPLAAGGDRADPPPFALYDRLIEGIPRPLPELLIAPTGMPMYYHYQTGHEAMSWAPEAYLDPERIGRVVYGLTREDRDGRGFVRLSPQYSYLTESQWRTLLDERPVPARLDWRNPADVRPGSLRRAPTVDEPGPPAHPR